MDKEMLEQCPTCGELDVVHGGEWDMIIEHCSECGYDGAEDDE